MGRDFRADVSGHDASCSFGDELHPVAGATGDLQNVMAGQDSAEEGLKLPQIALSLRLEVYPLVFGCSTSVVIGHPLSLHNRTCLDPSPFRSVECTPSWSAGGLECLRVSPPRKMSPDG